MLKRINVEKSTIRKKKSKLDLSHFEKDLFTEVTNRGKKEGRRGRGGRRYDALVDLMMRGNYEQLKRVA